MILNNQKELTPIRYGESAVKVLTFNIRQAGHICFDMHWHERMELLVILSGSIEVQIGNYKGTAAQGELVIIPPGKPHHGVTGENGTRYYTVMFDLSSFYNVTPVSKKILEPIAEQAVEFVPTTDDAEIFALAVALCREQLCNDESAPLIVVGQIYHLLGLLWRKCLSEQTVTGITDARLNNLLEYIEQHCCDGLSSSFLSKRFGYDEAYFCRRFKSVTGLTPMHYINILRLERAKKMLKNGSVSISDISVRCGFTDMSYFSRCFKKHYGMTPSAYIRYQNQLDG